MQTPMIGIANNVTKVMENKMVNTFLPHADFIQSAKALDNKRLGKQRVEAWQILQALLGKTKGWVNHPATRMWRNHEKSLCEYGIAICDEWIARGFNDSMRERFVAIHPMLPDCELPEWFGVEDFHDSHKSNLKRKNPDYYNFNVSDSLPYLWCNELLRIDNVNENNKRFKLTLLKFKLGNSRSFVLRINKQEIQP